MSWYPKRTPVEWYVDGVTAVIVAVIAMVVLIAAK